MIIRAMFFLRFVFWFRFALCLAPISSGPVLLAVPFFNGFARRGSELARRCGRARAVIVRRLNPFIRSGQYRSALLSLRPDRCR